MESNENIICEILDRSDKISAGKGRLWCPIPKCYFLMLSNRTMLTYPVPVCTCPSPSKLHTCKKLLLCTTLTHYNSFATAIAPRSSYCFLEIHNCWNEPRLAKIEPPQNPLNCLSNFEGNTCLIFTTDDNLLLSSMFKRCEKPSKQVEPPANTIAAAISRRMSTGVFDKHSKTMSGMHCTEECFFAKHNTKKKKSVGLDHKYNQVIFVVVLLLHCCCIFVAALFVVATFKHTTQGKKKKRKTWKIFTYFCTH